MRTQPEIKTTNTQTLTVLSVSPHEEDQCFLESVVGHSAWKLLKANNLFTARALLLQRRDISVVLCERDLPMGTWTDILKHIQPMPNPPSLIVTSRLADERLWSEVLNLGGWDVLAKPFDRSEIFRSVRSGWEHWYRRMETAVTPLRVARAAS